MERRTFLAALPMAVAAASVAADAQEPAPLPPPGKLKFGADGTFRILAITDLHFEPEPDPAALALIDMLIETERPNLVLADGDNLQGDAFRSVADVKTAVERVGATMEKRRVPWAVTLGNHDREHNPFTHLPDEAFFSFFENQPYNLNGDWQRGITGVGNKNILVWDAEGSRPQANLWLLDSGGKAPTESVRYQWIRHDQVSWYMRASQDLQQRYGPLPSLMFFHIPLHEFKDLETEGKYFGKHLDEDGWSNVNSGLFAALLERGDVMGVFCGHDHQNNYIGNWRGIALGYVGVTGMKRAYPRISVTDPANGHIRGGRMFELRADQPGRFKTWIRHLDGSRRWECWNDGLDNA